MEGPAPEAAKLPATQPLRVLVAEDNEVNLQLVRRLLERRGHSVTIATNGREALDRLAEHGYDAFDVVLMDVQMPGMDGIEASEAIRRHEESLETHLPIIGVTAHAMLGYRERCLRAGMDGYVTKPIQVEKLIAELDRVTSDQPRAQIASPEPAPPAAMEAFDHVAALERVEGDLELLTDLIQVFLDDLPPHVTALRKAVEGQDARGIEQEAHRLKGAASSLGANSVAASAARLEQSGRERNSAAAQSEWVQLEAELVRLQSAFRDFHPEVAR